MAYLHKVLRDSVPPYAQILFYRGTADRFHAATASGQARPRDYTMWTAPSGIDAIMRVVRTGNKGAAHDEH
jgi:hypothetical protein